MEIDDQQVEEIREHLNELETKDFSNHYLPEGEAKTEHFQDLFVQLLNFDETPSELGDATWQDLPVHEWRDESKALDARLFAEAGNFRVIYTELESLTRTAERNTIQSLTASDRSTGWAIEGSFLVVFHAPDEDVWHLVTPYEEDTDDITSGRPVLRRYTLGRGEKHRTVSEALAKMDASRPGVLSTRVDEAFRVKPVTERFYNDYKEVFDTLSSEFRQADLDIEEADRYAHIILNRLMFFYYLQKKGWIGGRKDFVHWFHEQYKESGDTDSFHEKWLTSLFFEGMNQPEGSEVKTDLPENVAETIRSIPHMNGGLFHKEEVDENDVFLTDAALNSVINGFLEEYNFTVTEESPYDIDVAVDPAMLGKIYESLIAEQERGEAGIFYTPRVEVDLMSRMAVYEQLIDHIDDPGPEDEERVVEFVFSEPQDWNADDTGETDQLEEILHNLKIVDPACGSGAFLVGMKQVLSELYRKVGQTPDYYLKEQIINENLYGVDIKGWAVRVAEFRLWLSLVEGEEELPSQRPILPNFSFKLRKGDSIVQTVNGKNISFEGIRREATGQVYQKLQQVQELKGRFFDGESDLAKEVETAQRDFLTAYFNSEIERLEKKASEQQTLGGESSESSNGHAKDRLNELRDLREDIQDATDDLFLWELDFPEVMFSGGFDIVIGNPPYVRHSDIISQGINPKRLDQMESSEVSAAKNQYKDNLIQFVRNKFDLKPYKRSDLYLYFYFKAIDLLQVGGSLAFVTSNSWLDANFGTRLQEGLLKYTDISNIFNNRRYRSFAEADVNTIIVIAQRKGNEHLTGKAGFTTINVPYDQVSSPKVMHDILTGTETRNNFSYRGENAEMVTTEEVRQIFVDAESLWRLGGGSVTSLQGDQTPTPSGTYTDGSWGKFVRAPDIYYSVLQEHGEKFKPLSEVADHIRRGVTSGANDFFYLPLPGHQSKYFESEFDQDDGKLNVSLRNSEIVDRFEKQGIEVSDPMFEIEYQYIMSPSENSSNDSVHAFTYTDDSGTIWTPNYLVKSPKEINGLSLSSDMVNHVILMASEPKDELDSGVQEYIKWGERWEPSRGRQYPNRPTCSSRSPWYDISGLQEADVLFPERVWSSYIAPTNPEKIHDNKNLYGLNAENPDELCVAMNAATTWLFLEVDARSSLGEGVLDIDVNMAEDVLVPDPDSGPIPDIGEIDLQGDLFEQLGKEPGEQINLEDVANDRRSIDNTALGDWLGMDEKRQKNIYRALMKLVATRIERSESV